MVQPTLPLFKTATTKITIEIVNFVLAKLSGRKAHMDRMLDLLELMTREHALTTRDQGLTTRTALETINKMADGQRAAARMFVAPVGETCAVARLGPPETALEIDRPVKEAILAAEPTEITPEKEVRIFISELDMQTGTCKVNVEGDEQDQRYASTISDPVFKIADNPYATAMTKQLWLAVKAKAEIKEGEVERLYILNTA